MVIPIKICVHPAKYIHGHDYYTDVDISECASGRYYSFTKPYGNCSSLAASTHRDIGDIGARLLLLLFRYECFDRIVLHKRHLEIFKGERYGWNNTNTVVLDELQFALGYAHGAQFNIQFFSSPRLKWFS